MTRRQQKADDLALFDAVWRTTKSIFDAVLQESIKRHMATHGDGIVIETYAAPERDQRFDALVPALMDYGKMQITFEISRTIQRNHRLVLPAHIENMARALLYHAEYDMLTDMGMFPAPPTYPDVNMDPDDAPHHTAYRQLITALANHDAVHEHSAIIRLSTAFLMLTVPNTANILRTLSAHMDYSADYNAYSYTVPHLHLLVAFHTAYQQHPADVPWEWIAPLVFEDMDTVLRDATVWQTAKRLDRFTDRVRRNQMRIPTYDPR